jgi:pyruvate, orthophosphate dikinase
VPTVAPTMTGDFATLMTWADKTRKLKIRTNADTPADAAKAREFGAEGIGLCRTEHMFFGEDRITAMREMILADTQEARAKALAKLLPFQKADFVGIFEAMAGLPVTIRLLDPPLHEFLPHDTKGQEEVAKSLGIPAAKVKESVEALHEFNPMMGFRGCRLPIVFPEIGDMQVRAIIEAAIDCQRRGVDVQPKIMIPLVGHYNELMLLRAQLEAVAKQITEEQGVTLNYKFGTMIEVPRAALTAGEIAKYADFFSFGTNDLTQTTFGYSRDDAEGKFLLKYVQDGILPRNPFQTVDVDGVGRLVAMAVKEGRAVNPKLEVGICGEHGGDPESIRFFNQAGLDYVSCSPFRVPIARLAAAQAALEAVERDK